MWSWPSLFGNANPVEIEVGFGKGLFLITAGQACPQTNFLGVEIDRSYQLYTANRLAKRRLDNVRVAKADARELFRDSIPAASVQAVHVYFPDPWWKKRHHKRRVFTAGFVAECARVLQPGGRLHLVTDVEAYYSLICGLIHENDQLAALPIPGPASPAHDLDYLTNYERKFRKEGRPIFRARYEKIEPL
jgi:tRNA (guanine-N7-)-methyltransferase